MKKIVAFLFFSASMFAQKQVFNVQKYCIDELPFKESSCDVSGNEYSFVFMDAAKSEVVLFLASNKLKYSIIDSSLDKQKKDFMVYNLKSDQGNVTMKVNSAKTKIEFLYPDKHISLKTGKSTKAD